MKRNVEIKAERVRHWFASVPKHKFVVFMLVDTLLGAFVFRVFILAARLLLYFCREAILPINRAVMCWSKFVPEVLAPEEIGDPHVIHVVGLEGCRICGRSVDSDACFAVVHVRCMPPPAIEAEFPVEEAGIRR